MTPFSGPTHRSWLSPVMRRQKAPKSCVNDFRVSPTTSGARASIAATHSSLPRPIVKVRPWPSRPSGESVFSITQAAVHDHARPDGGASLVRGEVGGHRGDLLRGYEPAVGLAGLHSLARLFGVIVAGGDASDPGCIHRARGDAVDPHPLTYVVYGRRPRERENATLRGRVGGPVVQAHQSGDGGHVDDGTTSGVPHRR